MYKVLIFLTFFIQYKIAVFSISDLALITLDFLALKNTWRFWTNKYKRRGAWLMIAGVALSFAMNFTSSWFSMGEFLGSVSKLCLYMVTLSILPQFLSKKRIDAAKEIDLYLKIVAVCAVLQIVIAAVLGRESWPLYSFGSIWFGFPSEKSMFAYQQMMRARVFYSEPGFMAVHITVLYIALLFTQKKLGKLTHLAYLIITLASFSLTGFFLMIAVYGIYFFDIKRRKAILRGIIAFGTIAVVAILLFNKNDYIHTRVSNLMRLQDHSGVVRTIGTFHFLTESPWYGTGVGNGSTFYKSLNIGDSIWYAGGGEFYNVIVVAAITMGYLGMLGLLIYQYSFMRFSKKLYLAFLATQFGWGALYMPPNWVVLLYVYLMMDMKEGPAQRKWKFRGSPIRAQI